MSQPFHVAAQPEPPKPPIVRLPTWVNVVLVLILLASCGANDVGNDTNESQIADQVVSQLRTENDWGTPGGPARSAEVEDLCRLMGAVAAKQGVPLTVMSAQEQTRCHEVAQEAGTTIAP